MAMGWRTLGGLALLTLGAFSGRHMAGDVATSSGGAAGAVTACGGDRLV